MLVAYVILRMQNTHTVVIIVMIVIAVFVVLPCSNLKTKMPYSIQFLVISCMKLLLHEAAS